MGCSRFGVEAGSPGPAGHQEGRALGGRHDARVRGESGDAAHPGPGKPPGQGNDQVQRGGSVLAGEYWEIPGIHGTEGFRE